MPRSANTVDACNISPDRRFTCAACRAGPLPRLCSIMSRLVRLKAGALRPPMERASLFEKPPYATVCRRLLCCRSGPFMPTGRPACSTLDKESPTAGHRLDSIARSRAKHVRSCRNNCANGGVACSASSTRSCRRLQRNPSNGESHGWQSDGERRGRRRAGCRTKPLDLHLHLCASTSPAARETSAVRCYNGVVASVGTVGPVVRAMSVC